MPEFSDSICAGLFSSASDVSEIVDESKILTKENDFVLLINPSKEIEHRLIPAYINATIRKARGNMHSDSLSLEILMFVSGTMNIGNAIERSGARGGRFVMFSSRKEILDKMVSRFSMKLLKSYNLVLDMGKCGQVAMTAVRDGK